MSTKIITSPFDAAFDDFRLEMVAGSNDYISIDLETTGLDKYLDRIVLYTVELEQGLYVFNIQELGKPSITEVTEYLRDSNSTIIGHNIKFDIEFLAVNTGILLTNVYDTMTMEVLITAGLGRNRISLATLVDKYFDVELNKDTRKSFIDLPEDAEITDEQILYATDDVKYLKELYKQQWKQVIAIKSEHVADLENKLVPVLADMELTGVLMDKEQWARLTEECKERAEELRQKIKEYVVTQTNWADCENCLVAAERFLIKAPTRTKRNQAVLEMITHPDDIKSWLIANFNPSSTQQMKNAFNLLGNTFPDTNEKTLNKKRNRSTCPELIDDVLSFRSELKMVSTYGENWFELINPVTGRVHTDYLGYGAATGRLSSGNPNMQNVPNKPERRKAFIASKGKYLMALDYSQEEYRLAGSVSREPVIIGAYKSGSDMHTATGMIVHGKKDLTKAERQLGKTVNFLILYGGSAFGLQDKLKLTEEQSYELINRFKDGYPVLWQFKETAENKILEMGYSITPFGRKRFNEEIPTNIDTNSYFARVNRVKREGFNHIIQGGGADIIKLAMVDIWYNQPFGNKFKIILQVHDELVFEIEKEIADEAMAFATERMLKAEQKFLGDLPAKVDGSYGLTWGDVH